jgi:Sulfotransferase domain
VTTTRLPNFLFLGPDKAGSSWLHEALLHHPSVYLSEAKDLYFFDRYYDRGIDWYASQFRKAGPAHTIIGEVSPDYLASPEAPERIATCLGQPMLMATLRDPAARAFSSYLYMRKHGLGEPTFAATMKTFPDFIEHGRYGTQLRRYLKFFPRESIHVALFDELQADPQAYFDGVTDQLGLSRVELSEEVQEARLPASKARFTPLAMAVRKSAELVRAADGARLVGLVKRSPLVHKLLYRPLGDEAPKLSEQDAATIREQLDDELQMVEDDWGLDLRKRWGWVS